MTSTQESAVMDFFRNEQYEYIDLGPDKYAWLDDVLTPRLSLDDLETLIAHTDEYMPPASADELRADEAGLPSEGPVLREPDASD